MFVGKPETGFKGNLDVSIGVGNGVPGTRGWPVTGLNGVSVLGLMGKPEVGSIVSGSPVEGL